MSFDDTLVDDVTMSTHGMITFEILSEGITSTGILKEGNPSVGYVLTLDMTRMGRTESR